MTTRHGLTLIELLVVLALIVILAALLFPPFQGPHRRPLRVVCMNNLIQLDLAIHMYLDDQNNGSPGNTNAARAPFLSWTDYRELIGSYVAIKGPSSPTDRVFACPADKFFYDPSQNGRGYVAEPMHDQTNHAFTSYAYNAGQFTTPAITNPPPGIPATTNYYGIAGQRLETVRHPAATVLIAETPAFSPYSWHEPRRPFSPENARFDGAGAVLSFVDGHAAYTKMYYNGQKIAWSYNPPAGYNPTGQDYQWSGD
jgi:prepilin-type N-terminal cleavage/methylation domain-containing protein